MLKLSTPITNLRMVGPLYGSKLKKLNIETIDDLLHHIPTRYEDFRLISEIKDLQAGEKATVIGNLVSVNNVYTKTGKKIQKALISDVTGQIEAIWYNQPFLTKVLKAGMQISLSGTVNLFGNNLVFQSPDYEIIKQSIQPSIQPQTQNLVHTGRLVPIYPVTAGLSSKWIRSRIYSVLHKWNPQIDEFLPDFILQKYELIGEKDAINRIHFPNHETDAIEGKRRLSFDELLSLSLASLIRKKDWESQTKGHAFKISKIKDKIQVFTNNLPFVLTLSQQKAVDEILNDLANSKPMNRLLEGDVGSGKTVVAIISIYATYLSGFQSVLIAPTEILASQHFETINQLLSDYGLKFILITGSNKNSKLLLGDTKFDIIIGTHALLSEKIKLRKLALVIIDEQQRFGVTQRSILRKKGRNPHFLSMTATPIPRSIALTIYADLDLSIIDEMPKGRKNIKSWVVPSHKREAAYNWINKQINSQHPRLQAFIICPFIDISETLQTIKAAKEEYKYLQKNIFSNLRLGLLHGKLKPKEKDKVLGDFKEGKLDILVTTPVVEVGIDIPRATIMMIEASERFGLAQLHQLRGRVGRNDIQSYCLFFTESQNEQTLKRLKMLETIFVGPKLAEMDLKLRGPGDIYGTKQHGILDLKIADFSDLNLFRDSKNAAELLISTDSTLSGFTLLRERLQKYTIKASSQD